MPQKFLDFMDQRQAEELYNKVRREFIGVFRKTWVKKEYKVDGKFGWHVFGQSNNPFTKDIITHLINFADEQRCDFMIFNGNLVKFI